jgi:kinesin family member 2/24
MVKKKQSSCLKEVEKIKQRREERRAAQQALREQQEQEFDTSAPNWEFEAMIRYI